MPYLTISELNALKPINSKLTAFAFGLSQKEAGGGRRTVICWCECGKTKKTLAKLFRNGSVTSCGSFGCKRNRTTHGFTKNYTIKHRLYFVWNGMKSRCYIKSDTKYSRYGGRGIMICDEWLYDFRVFFDWAITNGWEDGLKIDRINNNGNYHPDNCRFVNDELSMENRECTIWIEYNGKKLTVESWSKLLGIKSSTIRARLRNGWDIDKVLSTTKFKHFGYIKTKKLKS